MKTKIFNICDIVNFSNALDINTSDGVKRILDPIQVKYEIMRFIDWSFIGSESDTPTTAFNNAWSQFVDLNSFNFSQLYKAYMTDYDPLANYDKHSEITYSAEKTTNAYGEIKATTEHGTLTNTTDKNGNVQTATTSETTIESSAFVDKAKQTINNNARINETTQGDDTITTGAHTDTVNTDAHTVTEYTRGNVGTTRTAQMLGDELDARKNNLGRYIIELFINQYCFLFDVI